MSTSPNIQMAPAGQEAAGLHIGDLLFVHRPSILGWLIRMGQWLRPSLRPWSGYSHVAIITDCGGGLIQALSEGVVRGHIEEYRPRDYVIVHTHLSPDDQHEALNFVEAQLNDSYGWTIFISTALRVLIGRWGLWIGRDKTQICSGLAAQCLERGPYVFDVEAATMCPAELAQALRVPVFR